MGGAAQDIDFDLYLCSGMWGVICVDVRREVLVVREKTGLYISPAEERRAAARAAAKTRPVDLAST